MLSDVELLRDRYGRTALTGRAAAGVGAAGGLLDVFVGCTLPVAVTPVVVTVIARLPTREAAPVTDTGAAVGVRRPEDGVDGAVRVAETGRRGRGVSSDAATDAELVDRLFTDREPDELRVRRCSGTVTDDAEVVAVR